MFKSVKEQDSFKNTQTHYYLTQGDSCTITATPYKNGEVVNDGKSCKFRLATSDYKLLAMNQVDEKGNEVLGEDKKPINLLPIEMPEGSTGFVLNLTSDLTARIPAGSYIYEIEYTMENDEVQTPHSWKFDIIKQITK